MKNENPLPYNVLRFNGATQFPRRACLDQFTPAEKSIYDSVQEVEALGADKLLTEAVMLLQLAREKVADWLEGGTE
jgi:hypothetical protein